MFSGNYLHCHNNKIIIVDDTPVIFQTKWEESKMICWYYNGPPRLKIRPAKVERVFVKPEILIFRDILTETEMDKIKELASPRVMYYFRFILVLVTVINL